MTSEWLLNMSIKVLYLPKNFYTSQNKFLATPVIDLTLLLRQEGYPSCKKFQTLS